MGISAENRLFQLFFGQGLVPELNFVDVAGETAVTHEEYALVLEQPDAVSFALATFYNRAQIARTGQFAVLYNLMVRLSSSTTTDMKAHSSATSVASVATSAIPGQLPPSSQARAFKVSLPLLRNTPNVPVAP